MQDKYPHKFTLQGVHFQGAYLPPDVSLEVLAKIGPAIGAVLDKIDFSAAREDTLANAFGAALGGIEDARRVAPHFVNAYQVELNGSFMALAPFKDDVFTGKPVLFLAWLIAAIKEEYRDFLQPSGWNTLQDLAKICGFQITSKGNGPSGGSSTPEKQP